MQDAFHVKLRRRVEEEIRKRSEAVAQGLGIASMEDYRRRQGEIAALNDVLILAQEVEQSLYGNPIKGEAQ